MFFSVGGLLFFSVGGLLLQVGKSSPPTRGSPATRGRVKTHYAAFPPPALISLKSSKAG